MLIFPPVSPADARVPPAQAMPAEKLAFFPFDQIFYFWPNFNLKIS